MSRTLAVLSPLACLLLAACSPSGPAQSEYSMGERVPVGQLTYSVVDTSWKGQLGDGYQVRTPNQRFLLVTVSVTNGGGSQISMPLLQLEGANGQMYKEVNNGEGVDNYIGLLRNIAPAQTLQGRLLFDVPLSSYRLRVVDGVDPAFEKAAWVKLPLNLDGDAPLVSLPGGGIK